MAVIEDNKHFYVGLKAFIGKGDALLILRESEKFDGGGKWELPGGRIGNDEDDKTLQEVMLREVEEECGKALRVKVGDIVHVFRRQFANGEWVFLTGFDCEYLSGEVELSDEHCEYAWITQSDMEKYEFVKGYKEAIEILFSKKR